MRSSLTHSLLALAAASLLGPTPAVSQTFSKCNPLKQTCPSNPALGTSITADFTKGLSDQFTAEGNPTYDGNGASLAVKAGRDAPTLVSKFYIMFGRVDITMKAAPGKGIVSSVVLQSDDLDEIDWEWLGADNAQVQTNYFGKGLTTSYTRGAFHPNAGNQNSFKTYSIDWTADSVTWLIDGTVVRQLTTANAEPNQYPQTPMQLKMGSWSGGDPANPPGTVTWAMGPTDYSACPCAMVVKTAKVSDYSTGKSYSYSGTDGTWQSIRSEGGTVNPKGSGSPLPSASPQPSSAGRSSSAQPSPPPFGTSAGSSTTGPAGSGVSSYPGLPSGWTVSGSGKSPDPTSSSPSVPASQQSATATAITAFETRTTYENRGALTTMTMPSGASNASTTSRIPSPAAAQVTSNSAPGSMPVGLSAIECILSSVLAMLFLL
ncbi:MAG: hypothetical protein M1814_001413 [Vezdaea aestivalis]|nr:MAG: hypothetical protein M1814_001413 [Vezdaea aestivalis]